MDEHGHRKEHHGECPECGAASFDGNTARRVCTHCGFSWQNGSVERRVVFAEFGTVRGQDAHPDSLDTPRRPGVTLPYPR